MMIDVIINADKIPTCIDNVQISFRYTDSYKGSSNYKIISTSIKEAFRGWEKDDPWLRFLRDGLFRFDDRSSTADTKLDLAFKADCLIVSVSSANLHYNFLPSVIYMLISRHQSHAAMLEELAEFGTDMSQFPTFENAEDRIKSVEISGVTGAGAGSSVPLENAKKLGFIARTNINLQHKKSKASLDPNDEIESYSLNLSGFSDISTHELNSQIELFADAESNGFFVGKAYKDATNDKFLEIFWSTDTGEPMLKVEDLVSQNYSIGELLNVLNYDQDNTIRMEII